MKEMYLIHLSDYGGDQYYRLVGKEAWDYLNSPLPEFKGDVDYIEETPPLSVQQTIFDACYSSNPEHRFPDDSTCPEEITIGLTRGSPFEDRANNLQGEKIEGKFADFCRMSKLLSFCKTHDIKIVDEYEGLMY